MATTLNGLRKTAVLLLSLGDEQASKILKRLPADAVHTVRREMERVSEVPAEMKREVFAEFCRAVDGVESRHVSRRALVDDVAPVSPPFALLCNVSPQELQRAVANEHPQAIALMLIYLPRELASEVMNELPPPRQVEVIQCIAGLQAPDERVVREIERAVQERLPISFAAAASPPKQLPQEHTPLAEVLDAAQHPQHRAVMFEDMLMRDPAEIGAALANVDQHTIALALTTATEQLREWILRHVSKDEAKMIRASAQFLGPVRIADVEIAQQQILDAVRRNDAEE